MDSHIDVVSTLRQEAKALRTDAASRLQRADELDAVADQIENELNEAEPEQVVEEDGELGSDEPPRRR